MWSKYKFYFLGVALLGVVAYFYFRKKKANNAELEAGDSTEGVEAALVTGATGTESSMNIAKSLAYINN
jgi:LPXTG-motif cell wall-anchored protein